jgi:hypothetical protein
VRSRKVVCQAFLDSLQPRFLQGCDLQQQTHAMAPKYYVGQRISFDSHLCTVRYIGPVAGTQKEWLGVEWDDPAKGKHDGEHQGVKYFSCKSFHNVPSIKKVY